MASLTCSCDKSFEVELPDLIDLDAEPGRSAEILSGEFLALSCPHCGRRIKPEPRLRLVSRRGGIDLLVLPESERSAFIAGTLSLPAGSQSFLIGYAELHERILALSEGLDAEAVELLKYYILAKALASAPPESEIRARLAGREADGRLRFEISGLREGEVAVLRIDEDRLGRARSELPGLRTKEPFSRFLSGPYRSVRALEALALAED
jgi:hypothetical protein